ncbi:hypothetical protein A1O1_05045 [Capronia coronata CBS 617.96]|uniref:Sas10 C-terminal domain-containing protein n=1 Tax=Capronia coronata CBS 617.96 TaxID=1182541 RepID=W9Y5L3_9EURO|nr:uncharacterized protein A1O1_05045 [Capronia coronata CBS 617.96]EXJ88117.1 hypothetical protein A1O1_05045 [Capronia coronata CBS 617.96]
MAKKRKAGKAKDGVAPRASKTDYTYDAAETFDDSQDEFFAGRDKILLDEGPAAKRRRRVEEQEQDLQPSDEEVYQDLESEPESAVDEDDDDLDQESADEEADLGGRKRRQNGAGEEEDDDADDLNWGTSKADYYNADVIETEADALEEEAEARRLQQKQLKSMTEADFGFDETSWVDDSRQTSEKQSRAAVEKLPDVQVPENATVEERLQMLRSRYPEYEPLTKDFLRLQDTYHKLKKEAELARTGAAEENRHSVSVTKFRALSAYLGSVAMYLALLTSTSGKTGMALPPGELRDHPVMKSLVRCRELWLKAEALRPIEVQVLPEVESAPVTDKPVSVPKKDKKDKEKNKKKKDNPKRKTSPSLSPSPSPIPSMPELFATESDVKPKKKSRKTKRNDLQDLLEKSLQQPVEDESDFGDEAALTQEEAAEKARRKKSLRFYTSQIAQKANKRGAASRQAGGDDDVPHKERMRDKQERLTREAEQRGRSDAQGKEALGADGNDDDGDYDSGPDAATGRHLNDEASEYYNSLVASKQQKKAEKRAKAEAYAEAARQGAEVHEEEQIGEDGKRKITYAIEKNKGLAPKRKKDVRNPRVKKRKKYDEKLKKLASIRPVYKGGEGRGGYGGEATGIKTNVVKSIKL